MLSLNPSLLEKNDKLYMIVRNETNNVKWNNSVFSYSLRELDNDLKTKSESKCKFKINNNIFNQLIRKNTRDNFYIMEDIKIIREKKDGVIGVCNILVSVTPRKFRVALVKIDIQQKMIELIKILTIPNMNSDEKNWTFLDNDFIIYALFPELIIYKIDKNLDLHLHKKINTFEQIKNTDIHVNLKKYYRHIYLTNCESCLKLNNSFYLLHTKKRENKNNYKYYYCILSIKDWKLFFINNKIDEGKKYLNQVTTIKNKIYYSWGLEDSGVLTERKKIKINLIYFSGWNNFGDELSKFITEKLINQDKYQLVYNQRNIPLNLVCVGSYIHKSEDKSFIFGTGVRTLENKENGHKYHNLFISSVRGPLTRDFLLKRNINTPDIYGDPALLLSKFYNPILISGLKNKIALIPHKTNFKKYLNKIDNQKFFLINPTDDWKNVINYIYSCRAIISSSLHGLICSDSYQKPNLWLDEYKLDEGDFKFRDYFASQKREYQKIKKLSEYCETLLYTEGNKLNLEKLLSSFPFS